MPILNKKKISSKLKLHFKNLPPKGGGGNQTQSKQKTEIINIKAEINGMENRKTEKSDEIQNLVL